MWILIKKEIKLLGGKMEKIKYCIRCRFRMNPNDKKRICQSCIEEKEKEEKKEKKRLNPKKVKAINEFGKIVYVVPNPRYPL